MKVGMIPSRRDPRWALEVGQPYLTLARNERTSPEVVQNDLALRARREALRAD